VDAKTGGGGRAIALGRVGKPFVPAAAVAAVSDALANGSKGKTPKGVCLRARLEV
jgi:hypothetical protein